MQEITVLRIMTCTAKAKAKAKKLEIMDKTVPIFPHQEMDQTRQTLQDLTVHATHSNMMKMR